jgi:hypothetical protein
VWNACALPNFALVSDAATTIDTMQTSLNIPTMHTEATSVAAALPCPGSFDAKRRLGSVLALAGGSLR